MPPEAVPALRIGARPEMVFGEGAADGSALAALVRGLGAEAAFVVSDRGLVAAGLAGAVTDGLEAEGLRVGFYADIGPNPSVAAVTAGATALADFGGPAVIVALGGGSPIDAAKAIGLTASDPGPCPPLIAVPTTAGTGTETNGFGVIDDPAAGCKRYVGHLSATPRYAVLDPLLTVSAPPHVTAACGIDVLAHAIESAQARTANPYGAALACEAARLVFTSLPIVMRDPADVASRASMLLAAHLAGLAFATTGLGTAHAIGHALSARHGAAHGDALAAVLPLVVRFNAAERPAATARLATAVGCTGSLEDAVATLQTAVDLRPTLADLGVGLADLEPLVDAALADVVIANAPRVPAPGELLTLLREAHGVTGGLAAAA
jgi:alcohol dehydrogenase class IV